ncbi:MAG: homocysteine S-methyltransferase family protein, partial [Phycisphaerae bacterium]
PAKLEKCGMGDRVVELNAAGARLSLEGAGDSLVAASIGPTGEFVEPVGELTEAQMEAIYAKQIAAIYQAGVKALCIETMSSLEESRCAIRAAKKLNKNNDVICTLTFDNTPQGPRTMMGVSPAQAAAELVAAGADIVGANCGNGVEQMIAIAAEFRKNTKAPILIHANAGMPQLIDGKTVFKQTPSDMAKRVKELVAAGANIVGGCCGTTPEHIAAIKVVIDELRK